MTYQALARRWRPRTLTKVVGQPFAVRALKNALDQQRLHHAYLFTGTHGVGKTTLGRLFAKCLSCTQGVSSAPCGQCEACIAIDQGQYVDLIEVDAASRTKVEETRELLENVAYLPNSGTYKIYLIDEVHMLSSHSFNALLKTLEEPPPHVKFLLATTDPDRLPMTVVSRCLRIHLNKISVEQIKSQLQFVLEQEQCSFEVAALAPLALAAQGSLRDALSLLEQALNLGGGSLSLSVVEQLLGLISRSLQEALCEALVDRNLQQFFKIAHDLDAQGVQPVALLHHLQEVFHQAALLQVLPEAYSEAEAHISAQLCAHHFSAEELQIFYQITLLAKRDLDLALTPRQGMEMFLLRLYSFMPVPKANTPSVIEKQSVQTPAEPWAQIRQTLSDPQKVLRRQEVLEATMKQDPVVQTLLNTFDATIDRIEGK